MYEFDPQELRLLNEIGRVLSATLDQEDLLRKVWEQLGRLIDVKNFYMASLRPGSGEILFDLEVIDGVRMSHAMARWLPIVARMSPMPR
jgi:hypothetical protein